MFKVTKSACIKLLVWVAAFWINVKSYRGAGFICLVLASLEEENEEEDQALAFGLQVTVPLTLLHIHGHIHTNAEAHTLAAWGDVL